MFASLLLGRGDLNDAAYAAMQKEVEAEVADAVAFAEQGTWEPVAELTRFVYSDSSPVARSGT
ncbi:hypothetical protein D3C83_183370 [compost metagenome]